VEASAFRTSIHDRPNRCKIASATAAMSAPITSPSSFAKTAAITVHVFGHYYGLPVHSTCPLHPRTSDMPEHIIKGHLRGDT
jgi:hypothetical protein